MVARAHTHNITLYMYVATHVHHVAMYIPELFSTLKVLGGLSLEDFKEPSNTHGLFSDVPPNSCIMKDTPIVIQRKVFN